MKLLFVINTVRSTCKIGQNIATTTSSLRLESSIELDTHANKMVLGKNCLAIQDLNQPVYILGFNSTLGTIECLTVTGVVVYDHPVIGQTYMLEFHQANY